MCGEHSRPCPLFSARLRFIPACAGNTLPLRSPAFPCAVHPRVCGEHASRQFANCPIRRFIPACAGNTRPCTGRSISATVHPPRVRGTPDASPSPLMLPRFIPACAGNTAWFLVSLLRVLVHPRVCGEHPGYLQRGREVYGSSPRVRGTPHLPCLVCGLYRFIPACAGNTCLPSCLPVHPRVCGEHLPAFLPAGSSPRVRGTPNAEGIIVEYLRFIPACAGNTPHVLQVTKLKTVHPRVCGEHTRRPTRRPTSCGSSPRVRGTHVRQALHTLNMRFIPACAGNTKTLTSPTSQCAVHPRVCGEHGVTYMADKQQDGSSPRVRGTPRCGSWRILACRFIPACAGNTNCQPQKQAKSPVHPRVCGEHLPRRPWNTVYVGSSPRVRGTLVQIPFGEFPPRFIPACAGEHATGGEQGPKGDGSSPRVRGTPHRLCLSRPAPRFIPACAGNTVIVGKTP